MFDQADTTARALALLRTSPYKHDKALADFVEAGHARLLLIIEDPQTIESVLIHHDDVAQVVLAGIR